MQDPNSVRNDSALQISLIYAIVAGIWILVSDYLVFNTAPDPDTLSRLQTFKGILFVISTTLLLYFLIQRDMKRRLVARQELLETKQLLESTLNSLQEAVFVINPKGRTILECNPAVERIFGYRPEELIGRSTELLHVSRQSFEEFGTIGDPELKENGIFRTEYQMKCKDGKVIYTENTVTTIYGPENFEMGVVSVVRDITDRVRARQQLEELVLERTEALREEKERTEAVLQSAGEGVVVVSVDGIIQQSNPAFSRQTGIAMEDLNGMALESLAVTDTVRRNTVVAEISQALEDGIVWRGEMVVKRKDQTIYDAAITLTPMLTPDGELLAFVGNIRDISARKAVEKMKDEFLSTAAHELRTPLTSIRAFSELLMMRDYPAERLKRYHRLINEQSVQLASIIDDMLDITRLEAGRGLDIVRQPVKLGEVVRTEVDFFRESQPTHTYVLEGFDDLPPVSGDAFRLAQVVRNLVSNAVKYSSEGGSITIQAKSDSEAVTISVQDEGIGMTDEQLTHLFEKFYRANERDAKGTGLGLNICKLIVEGHDGHILVDSAYGEGTIVTFTLPLTKSE